MPLSKYIMEWFQQFGPFPLPPLPLLDPIVGGPLNPVAPGEPFPIEPDGGIGDGAPPLPLPDNDEDKPIPVEPDGGIGDGAGPLPTDGDDKPIPVEPDGGIGDGAGPLPTDGDNKPIPVEPDGGIGDGGQPAFDRIFDGAGEGTEGNDLFEANDEAETFVFVSGGGSDAIKGFDTEKDTLDLSGTVLKDIKDVINAASENADHVLVFAELEAGVVLKTGDGAYGYIEGITIRDLETMNIVFEAGT